MSGSILAGADRMRLENGMELRLLSALEVLQVRRQAEELAEHDRERALCSNACLIARVLEEEGKPVFESGGQVLAGMTLEEIGALAKTWSEFNRRENPSVREKAEETELLKKN